MRLLKNKNSNIQKNVKDLEYHRILSLITSAIVIYATIVITTVFTQFLSDADKMVIIASVSIVSLVIIRNLYTTLNKKLEEIKRLK